MNNDFQEKMISIGNESLHHLWVSDIIAALTLLVLLYAGYIAKNHVKSARWGALLSLEQDMSTRRKHLNDVARALAGGGNTSQWQEIYDEAKESYLNAVERLSSMILNGEFPRDEMKQDYKEVITNVVRTMSTDFQSGTLYRKTLKLYNKWQDEN